MKHELTYEALRILDLFIIGSNDIMKFSQFYYPKTELVSDGNIMRNRIGSYIQNRFASHDDGYSLVKLIKEEVGVSIPTTGWGGYDFEKFFKEEDIKILLDIITIVCIILKKKDDSNFSTRNNRDHFANFVNRCFSEEGLSYALIDRAFIRFKPDKEFENQRISTLKYLETNEFIAAKHAFDLACKELQADGKHNKSSLHNLFEANETLFKIVSKQKYNFDQLNSRNISTLKEYIINRQNNIDKTEKESMKKNFESYKNWVEAMHFYRHGQDDETYTNPSIDFTISLFSQGASHLRWIASLASSN